MNDPRLLKSGLEKLPRQSLSHLPTPLERMDRLSKKLGRANLFIKRDDQTGLAFGGNKARKLDFIMADVRRQQADTIITWAGVQSNWCRQTAAAARKLGIKPLLILFKRPSQSADYDGNLLLNSILGATIKVIELDGGKSYMELAAVKEVVEAVVEEELSIGRSPYIAPIGGSLWEGSMSEPWGAISYVAAAVELLDQAEAQGVQIDYVVLATGSGSTQAGLVAGVKTLCPDAKVIGISVSEPRATMTRYVTKIANETLKELHLIAGQTSKQLGLKQPGLTATIENQNVIVDEDVIVFDEYIKEGYGILNSETVQAIRLVAETEGILLDPVYTGKAMAGLLDLLAQGYFKPDANIVFLHSGGTPALFPYKKGLHAT